jgi:ATP-binding cassette subfamily C (CFTR/MRP) protein 1
LLLLCLTVLFFSLGVSFIAGISVFVLAFFANVAISRARAKLQKLYMKKQDGRVSLTTECLNSIKMLKLYAWTDIFFDLISKKRDEELEVLRKSIWYGVAIVSTLYLFPLLLQSVAFTAYIGFGNVISLSQAFVVLTILALI